MQAQSPLVLFLILLHIPIEQLKRVRQVGDHFHASQVLALHVHHSDHLPQELPRVSEELLQLHVSVNLVELLHFLEGAVRRKGG